MNDLFCSKCGKTERSQYFKTCECLEPNFIFQTYEEYMLSKITNYYDDELLESVLCKLEQTEIVTVNEYYNLKNAIRELRRLTKLKV